LAGGNGLRCASARPGRPLRAAVDLGCGLSPELLSRKPGKMPGLQLTGGCPTGKAQVVDNADGIVLDHTVMVGNPPDAPLLAPAIGRVVARTGKVPRAVAPDRGYGEPAVEQELITSSG
jgi:hypothetical protein